MRGEEQGADAGCVCGVAEVGAGCVSALLVLSVLRLAWIGSGLHGLNGVWIGGRYEVDGGVDIWTY